jgi:hypothetical protein
MHPGFGSGTRFGSGFKYKMDFKSKKEKKLEANFLANNVGFNFL